MSNKLSFERQATEDGFIVIIPCIDGVALPDMVAAFETARNYDDPAGGYGGIAPSYFNSGPLDNYFLGRAEPVEGDVAGEIYVLACRCGEAGCWPLIAVVRQQDEYFLWSDFRQPHRPKRDYTEFGPFVFARDEYEAAIRELMAGPD